MIIYDNSDSPYDSNLKYESYQSYIMVNFSNFVIYFEEMRLPLKKVVCAHSFDNFSEALTTSIHLVGELNYCPKLESII